MRPRVERNYAYPNRNRFQGKFKFAGVTHLVTAPGGGLFESAWECSRRTIAARDAMRAAHGGRIKPGPKPNRPTPQPATVVESA